MATLKRTPRLHPVIKVPAPRMTAAEIDTFDERAAVAEFDGGLSRKDAEILAAICSAPPPAGATPEQVNSVIDAAARFLERRRAYPRTG